MNLKELDPVLVLLLAGMILFTLVLLYCEHRFKDDAQLFQVIASLVAGFSGAFFGRIKPAEAKPQTPVAVENQTTK